MADNEEGVDLSAEDFVDKLWQLAITLLLIMVSGENLIEHVPLQKPPELSESEFGKYKALSDKLFTRVKNMTEL